MNIQLFVITLLAFLLPVPNARSQTPLRATQSSVVNIPSGFNVAQEIRGDLNQDGQEDRVYIVKGTDKTKFFDHEFRGKLDRNRRGIIVALQSRGRFETTTVNLDCFSSENEDGGVYYAPELDVAVQNGTLSIHYAHGKYGYWSYRFRFQNGEFELIGYESSQDRGPTVLSETSINFSTKRMRLRENVNQNATEGSEERFKETWKSFTLSKPITLRAIKNFEELDVVSKLSRVN